MFAPGDLRGVIMSFTGERPLLKVTASTDQMRFDPATWCIRRDFRATNFGRDLEYLSFHVAGWKHRDYTEQEWAYLEDLSDWAQREGRSSWRPIKKGIDVLEWPIIMQRTEQRFPEAFDLMVAKIGPKRRRISVNEFNRIKKQALWEVLQEQRKAGQVDPELEGVNHWSM